MAHFIDRRLNGKNKSTVNRQRFLRRHKQQIKESIADAVNKRSITDVDSGEDISIPSRDISEPSSVKDKTNLYSRSPKMNILTCFLKISNYQIYKRTK